MDSGSSASFISQSVVSKLSDVVLYPTNWSVRVANGEFMQCTAYVASAAWAIGNCQFTHDLKVLPLTQYDIIHGVDWLQVFSPMKIHWQDKWISFPYGSSTVIPHGLHSNSADSHDEVVVRPVAFGRYSCPCF